MGNIGAEKFGGRQVRMAPETPVAQYPHISKQTETMDCSPCCGPERLKPTEGNAQSLLELSERDIDRCHLVKNARSASWLLTLL